jgi:hypothetical protein
VKSLTTTSFETIFPDRDIQMNRKKQVGTFADLKKLGHILEINGLNVKGMIAPIRHITNQDDIVILDACTGLKEDIIRVPLETPIIYEPWFLDRGSYIFDFQFGGEIQTFKLATEFDTVHVFL